MGCCQSNPNDMNSASEMGKELTDIHLAEYEPNIISLEKKIKTPDQIIRAEPEKVSMKESSYHKDTKSEKQEEESKKITEQPSDIKWSIKQSMFVKINSHKNVGEYYAIKELIGQGGFGKVYKVTHRQTGYILYSQQAWLEP
ncbi:unnamed protein product [Paramecium primaurelia]|uniref:Protein kinase domain-containing protein n=1 Tax=Paramecium primaurelia TaxID=5886 RepID=A0A8S1P2D7_PARPR|nr:unnamed protein product [Paramecium primaurelia]